MFGLDPDTIRNINKAFAKFPDLEKVLLYGSRAKGNYKNGSDIDITLIGKNLTLSNSVYPLMDELDELYLPYTFDISIFKQIDNLDLVEHILHVGKTLYLIENGKLKVENDGSGENNSQFSTFNSQLPKGWEVKKLGDVCEIFNGSTPLRRKKEFWVNGTINWFTIDDIRKQGRKIKFTNQKITAKGFENSSLRLLPVNSVLLCCTASVGEFAITETELTTNQQFNGLVVKNENCLASKYLYYFSSTLKDRLLNVSGKTTIDFVSMTKLKQIQIPIPPLAEQQRIVKILDKAFVAIDKAKQNAEQNLRNAKELFENYLQGVFDNKGDDWEKKTLKEISEDFGRGKSKHRPRNDKKLYGGDYPFIQTGDIRNCEHYITAYSQTYNDVGLAQSKLWTTGTICITIAANIAETGILSFDACFPDSVIGIVVNKKITNVDFVEYLLQSFKVNIKSLGKGSAQDNINMGTFEDKLFPFPSIAEQKQIVKKLNNISAETKKLETIYQKTLANLAELKKSILQKAFRGEL